MERPETYELAAPKHRHDVNATILDVQVHLDFETLH